MDRHRGRLYCNLLYVLYVRRYYLVLLYEATRKPRASNHKNPLLRLHKSYVLPYGFALYVRIIDRRCSQTWRYLRRAASHPRLMAKSGMSNAIAHNPLLFRPRIACGLKAGTRSQGDVSLSQPRLHVIHLGTYNGTSIIPWRPHLQTPFPVVPSSSSSQQPVFLNLAGKCGGSRLLLIMGTQPTTERSEEPEFTCESLNAPFEPETIAIWPIIISKASAGARAHKRVRLRHSGWVAP